VLDQLGERKATMSARVKHEASKAGARACRRRAAGSGSGLLEGETGTLGSEIGARGSAERGDASRTGGGSAMSDGTLGGATGARVGGEPGARGADERGWTARQRMSATLA
jgi:hypothetical protein